MVAKNKVRITVDEDPAIVQRVDKIARDEGLSRNDIMRRALRHLLFSISECSASKTDPLQDQQQAA